MWLSKIDLDCNPQIFENKKPLKRRLSLLKNFVYENTYLSLLCKCLYCSFDIRAVEWMSFKSFFEEKKIFKITEFFSCKTRLGFSIFVRETTFFTNLEHLDWLLVFERDPSWNDIRILPGPQVWHCRVQGPRYPLQYKHWYGCQRRKPDKI